MNVRICSSPNNFQRRKPRQLFERQTVRRNSEPFEMSPRKPRRLRRFRALDSDRPLVNLLELRELFERVEFNA
ncbi:MAG: hypothetical protein II807_04355 [Thermoguttaceae bacterium]|nr:hypothetical protein [Thermoguttaceae bacterium]